jgi:hypothetical protein
LEDTPEAPLREPDHSAKTSENGDDGKARRHLAPSSSVVANTAIGICLVSLSYLLYANGVSPPQASTVHGDGTLYVGDPAIQARLSVEVYPDEEAISGSKVLVDLDFLSQRQVSTVKWALVLTGDACFVEQGQCVDHTYANMTTGLPQGARVTVTEIGQTPFSGNKKDEVAQIIYGQTKMDTAGGRAGNSRIAGFVKGTVADTSNQTWNLRLPSYGRLNVPPLFTFPARPGAIDLSIPGSWHRPEAFEVDVQVDSPGTDARHRIDSSSPPLLDPSRLRWQSGESVLGVVQRTDLAQEAKQQSNIFVLGALVGAGASLVLVLLQWALERAFSFAAVRASHLSRAFQGRPKRSR